MKLNSVLLIAFKHTFSLTVLFIFPHACPEKGLYGGLVYAIHCGLEKAEV